MKQKNKTVKLIDKKEKRKCGAITCIHNVCGQCQVENCAFYENLLIQEY
ncbi:MAG: hypothetical protein GX080_09285 [Tissierellia bacterium]|nr:hypothetical protein [Tissierellia bacterium]